MGIRSSYTQFAIFAGPALAGWIIVHCGSAAAFATNVFGYAWYLATIACLRTPPGFRPPPPSGRSVFGDLTDGARYIGGHRGILALLALMLVGDALAAATTQMLPAYAAHVLGMGVAGMAWLLAAVGFGATAAALWLAHGGIGRTTPMRVLWAALAHAAAVACLALANRLTLAVLAMAGYGVAGEIRRTGTVALLQMAVSDAQRGRVMSTQFLLQRTAGGIGTYLIGAFAEHDGLRRPLLVAAAIAVLAWMLAFAGRRRIAASF